MIGFDYCDVGKQLGEAWNLPATLVQAMAYHTDTDFHQHTDGSARLVGLTVTMLSALQRKRPWTAPPERVLNLQISETDTTRVFDRLSGQLTEIQKLAEILFAK